MQCMKILVDEEAIKSLGKLYTAFQYQALHHCAVHQMFQNKPPIYLILVLILKHSCQKKIKVAKTADYKAINKTAQSHKLVIDHHQNDNENY